MQYYNILYSFDKKFSNKKLSREEAYREEEADSCRLLQNLRF